MPRRNNNKGGRSRHAAPTARDASPANTAAALQRGLAEHRAGDLSAAARFYRQVIAREPRNPDALYLLGVVFLQRNNPGRAVDLMGRALQDGPATVEILNNLAQAHHRLGNIDEAERCYRRALEIEPAHSVVHANLANLLSERGRSNEAITHYKEALARNKEHAAATVQLGVALAQQSRLAEAMAILQQAIDLLPDHAEARFSLGNVFASLGELDQAIEHYSRAARLMPDRRNIHINLGNALYEQGRITTAITSFRRAIDLDPGEAEIHHNLGNVLVSAGRIDEARDSFRRAIALRPDFASAHEALGRTKRYHVNDPDLAQLERLAGRRDLPQGEHSSALFGLAKALDDTGDYARAFAALTKANAHERARRRFDLDAFARLCRDVIARFDRPAFERAAGGGFDSPRPIFIVGMPRSGTTLIEQILAAHPHVGAGGELLVLPRLVEQIAAAGASEAWPSRVTAAEKSELEEWGRTYADGLGRLTGTAPRATDKLPANFLHVGLIHMILPNAAIVHCRRDPVATCFSCYQHHFTAAIDYAFDLGELGGYYRLYDEVMTHWHRVLPGSIYDVHYEDVVADREGQTRRLLDHLGLEWNDTVLEFHKAERPVMTASAAQVRRPIYDRAVAHWRHYERFLGPLLEALGPLAQSRSSSQ